MAYAPRSYNWQDLNRMTNAQLERTLVNMRKAAMQRKRSATAEMLNISRLWGERYNRVAAAIDRSPMDGRERRYYLLNRISSAMEFLNQQTTTRQGFKAWAENMRQAIKNALGARYEREIDAMDIEDIQTLAETIQNIKDVYSQYALAYGSEEYLEDAAIIFIKNFDAARNRIDLTGLRDAVKQAGKDKAAQIEAARKAAGRSVTGISY